MALTQQQVDAYNAGRIFDANKLQELQRLGATRVQMAAIASKAAIITDEVAKALPEIATPNFMKGFADVSKVPAEFDWIKYLNANPELDALGIDTQFEARFHYAQTGNKESKPSAPSTTAASGDKQSKPSAPSKTAESSYTPPPLVEGRVESFKTIREELANQYNSLVKLAPSAAYKGDVEDLERTIFADQARLLRDAGVRTISDLTIEDGKLINKATGLPVTTTNLGGQVVRDERTGVLKWGDTKAGVKGAANYGVQTLPDGSLLFFPAYKKTASPLAQVGLDFLEPLAALGGTVFGTIIGGPAGAGIGNSIGQLLATGDLDLEKALAAAALAYGASEISSATAGSAGAGQAGGSGISAGAGGETGLLSGSGGVTGITPPAGFKLAPDLVAGSSAGLLGTSEIDLLGGTDFSRIGETGISGVPSTSGSVYDPLATAAPGVGEGIIVLPPSVAGGAATIAGLEAPGLSAMGGAQGITVPIQGGGVVSEMGFVPPGATPSLGDPGSFINNPDYLGSPVISEDYLALTGADMPSGISLKDAFDAARLGSRLLGGQQQQQQQQQGGLLGGGGGVQVAGVSYAPLYGNQLVGLLPLAEQYRRSLL